MKVFFTEIRVFPILGYCSDNVYISLILLVAFLKCSTHANEYCGAVAEDLFYGERGYSIIYLAVIASNNSG